MAAISSYFVKERWTQATALRVHRLEHSETEAPFTRYNLLSNRLSTGLTTGCIVYTNIQPVGLTTGLTSGGIMHTAG